ncbi:MAG: N-6 DNA methylase [Thermoplasmataceae archaeon]
MYFKNVRELPESLGINQKDLGAYYTDQEIVSYIINNLNISPGSSVLDPSCGCGSFLVPLFLRDINDKTTELSRVFGVDIDEKAINYAISVLARLQGIINTDALREHIVVGDFIGEGFSLDHINLKKKREIGKVISNGGFDYVIGNPPFNVKGDFKSYAKFTNQDYCSIARETNSMPVYFILKGLELLKENGTLAFVLPKSLLYVGKYQRFRSYVSTHFTILNISEIGLRFKSVRGEQIILMLRKKIPDPLFKIKFSVISKDPDGSSHCSFATTQATFSNGSSIPSLPSIEMYRVIEKIGDNPHALSRIFSADICRGVSLEPNRISIIPFPKDDSIPAEACVRGKDIMKFNLRSLALSDPLPGDSTRVNKLRKPKIILQNIFSSESGIISYLDNSGLLTAETVTNIIIDDPSKRIFLFGLLNSKLLNFYLSQKVFSGSKLTMHMDRYYLDQLPIVWNMNRDETHAIVNLICKSLKDSIQDHRKLLSTIDELVYRLYGLSEQDQKVVENYMKNVLSHKSVW